MTIYSLVAGLSPSTSQNVREPLMMETKIFVVWTARGAFPNSQTLSKDYYLLQWVQPQQKFATKCLIKATIEILCQHYKRSSALSPNSRIHQHDGWFFTLNYDSSPLQDWHTTATCIISYAPSTIPNRQKQNSQPEPMSPSLSDDDVSK